MEIRKEIFQQKLAEINANLEAATNNLKLNRYTEKIGKDGEILGTVDYQEIIDYLNNLKQAIEKEI